MEQHILRKVKNAVDNASKDDWYCPYLLNCKNACPYVCDEYCSFDRFEPILTIEEINTIRDELVKITKAGLNARH